MLDGAMPATMLADMAKQLSRGGISVVYNQNSTSGSGSDTADTSGDSSVAGTPDPDNEEKAKLVSNPKHHPNSASPEPTDVEELYDNSVVDDKG